MTNEELENVAEQAVDSNIIYYKSDKVDLVRLALSGLFLLAPFERVVANINLVGIEYIIAHDFTPFDLEGFTDKSIKRVELLNAQKQVFFDKFKSLNAVWPQGQDHPEWFFIIKSSWGRYYLASTVKDYNVK